MKINSLSAALVAAMLTGCSGSSSLSGASGDSTTPFSGDTDLGGVDIFPADNPWNQDISGAPVDPLSDDYLASIGLGTGLHPDFGSNPDYGIPYVVVDGQQPPVPVTFDYDDESDPGPYPIPAQPPVEGGGDRHILVIDRDNKLLYELFAAERQGGGWHAGSGAIWSLLSNELRPEGWTSADAAGLPILPGLVRADEVLDAGEIRHALRFTVSSTQRGYVHPARHFASDDTDPALPPMGLRVRLKADFDLSSFPADCQVILTALKKYGMMVADNGSNWFISGAPDPRWNDDTLHELGRVKGSDFEVIETGEIVRD